MFWRQSCMHCAAGSHKNSPGCILLPSCYSSRSCLLRHALLSWATKAWSASSCDASGRQGQH